jgi:hypothetical protein
MHLYLHVQLCPWQRYADYKRQRLPNRHVPAQSQLMAISRSEGLSQGDGRVIYIEKNVPLIDCEVVNMSEGGAKLCALTPLILPTHFLLFLTQDGSLRRSCRVIWRNGRQLGVEFEEEEFR